MQAPSKSVSSTALYRSAAEYLAPYEECKSICNNLKIVYSMHMTGLQVDFEQPNLIDAFLWDATPQGFHYWEHVNDLIMAERQTRKRKGQEKFRATMEKRKA